MSAAGQHMSGMRHMESSCAEPASERIISTAGHDERTPSSGFGALVTCTSGAEASAISRTIPGRIGTLKGNNLVAIRSKAATTHDNRLLGLLSPGD
jgi:hypothetical protein